MNGIHIESYQGAVPAGGACIMVQVVLLATARVQSLLPVRWEKGKAAILVQGGGWHQRLERKCLMNRKKKCRESNSNSNRQYRLDLMAWILEWGEGYIYACVHICTCSAVRRQTADDRRRSRQMHIHNAHCSLHRLILTAHYSLLTAHDGCGGEHMTQHVWCI